jgi:hypothetical protein
MNREAEAARALVQAIIADEEGDLADISDELFAREFPDLTEDQQCKIIVRVAGQMVWHYRLQVGRRDLGRLVDPRGSRRSRLTHEQAPPGRLPAVEVRPLPDAPEPRPAANALASRTTCSRSNVVGLFVPEPDF